jgi:hypothetical protein
MDLQTEEQLPILLLKRSREWRRLGEGRSASASADSIIKGSHTLSNKSLLATDSAHHKLCFCASQAFANSTPTFSRERLRQAESEESVSVIGPIPFARAERRSHAG